MEERKLRSRLISIYFAAIAVVLAALLVALSLFSTQKIDQRGRESFSTLITAIGDELQSGDIVVYSKLSRLEQENRLTLRIYDNRSMLLYNATDDADTTDLFARVEETARKEGYDIASLPLTNERRTSPIGEYKVDGARYYAAVSIVPIKTGYRTLTIVQQQEDPGAGSLMTFSAIYLVGLLLLGVAGAWLIDRALAPAIESRRRQTQFVAAASHELRSPLAVISANLATLPKESRNSAAADVMQRECERMSRLIGDMLFLASADADAWPVQMDAVEVDTLVLNVYEAYLPICRESGVGLNIILPEESLRGIRADGERLKQVIGTLLDNALAYGVTDKRRSIELEAAMQKRRVVIRVIDHGPGLTSEQKAHVFDRFYRADASRKDKQHFGLGLSIASELVSLNNGSLCVTDTPGGGCTFSMFFD
ncbi:MAG: HAMP domain-containing sensor histidine kinase [Eubacteriales bacterium]|nr:HAMP domain-containing sensor histidine kinase [Eubacteriales bacterium]